jgi:hypothetical protein
MSIPHSPKKLLIAKFPNNNIFSGFKILKYFLIHSLHIFLCNSLGFPVLLSLFTTLQCTVLNIANCLLVKPSDDIIFHNLFPFSPTKNLLSFTSNSSGDSPIIIYFENSVQ